MAVGQISFGPFVLDRGAHTLLSGGKPVALGQRGFALLDALAAGDGNVSKADLIEAAWPGTIVEEGNLTVQIAALRKALGTRPDGQEWIVTVPRVGYRLLRGSLAEEVTGESGKRHLPSIAVLPFQNLSSDPEQEYFADGVVEDLTTALSRFRSLVVTARNSSFLFKGKAVDVRDIARQLNVRYLLEGSVRRAGNSLRITTQLVDGETGAHLWAERFDGPLEDVFAMQDRITAGVVAIVEPTIRQAEIDRATLKPPSSLDSYDLYLQALSVATSTEPGDTARATELIERSLALDPEFPPALAIAATIEVARFDRQHAGASEERRLKGLDYAHRALATRSDATTRAIAGVGVIILGFEYDTGMAALRQSAAENANSTTILGYAGTGAVRACEFEESERYFRRAIELNPSDLVGHWFFTGMAHINTSLGRFEDAIGWSNRALAVAPSNQVALWMLIASLAQLGRIEDASAGRERLSLIDPGCSLQSIRRGQSMRDPRRLDVIIDGLRLAGLREQ